MRLRDGSLLAALPCMQVKKINYAGLQGHAGHALHIQQATSGGSLLSFETGSTEASKVS